MSVEKFSGVKGGRQRKGGQLDGAGTCPQGGVSCGTTVQRAGQQSQKRLGGEEAGESDKQARVRNKACSRQHAENEDGCSTGKSLKNIILTLGQNRLNYVLLWRFVH